MVEVITIYVASITLSLKWNGVRLWRGFHHRLTTDLNYMENMDHFLDRVPFHILLPLRLLFKEDEWSLMSCFGWR